MSVRTIVQSCFSDGEGSEAECQNDHRGEIALYPRILIKLCYSSCTKTRYVATKSGWMFIASMCTRPVETHCVDQRITSNIDTI